MMQVGTDSGPGEGKGDYTHYGVIYDHLQRVVYWRTATNQNLQQVRLGDVLRAGMGPSAIPIMENSLLFANNAVHAFRPVG